MSRYDWSALDKRANFAFTGSYGEIWQSSERPHIEEGEWYLPSCWFRLVHEGGAPCADWQDSLETRP